MSAVRIGVVFPATFNLNADAANATVVARRLTLSGIDTEVVPYDIDAMARGDMPDALIIGSPSSTGLDSEDARSPIARDFIASAHASGVPILAVSNGFHWLGTMTGKDGTDLGGLGVIPVHTRFGATQHVTIGAQVDSSHGELIGVENHNATCELRDSSNAFGRVVHGVGNARDGVDGYADHAVWATHLHGPVFALNSALADAFASKILERRGETFTRGIALDDFDRLAAATAAHLIRKRSA